MKTLEIVGIEVPENKKLVRTDMEKGVLFTFEEKYDDVFNFEKCYSLYDYVKPPIPFKLFSQQQELLDSIINNQFTVVKKFRQSGLSSVVMAYITSELRTGSDKKIVVVTPNFEIGRCLHEKVMVFLQQQGHVLNFSNIFGERKKIIFNGNTVEFTTNMRGINLDNVTHIFIDEADFVDDSVISSIIDSEPKHIKFIIGSTPNPTKENSYFRKLWNKEDSQLSKVELKVDNDPRFDYDWKCDMFSKMNCDVVKYDTEINGNFVNNNRGKVFRISISELNNIDKFVSDWKEQINKYGYLYDFKPTSK